MYQECRQAARRLARSPAFSLTAGLTLALAIGANTAIFAVVHRVVLNPLPYGDSGRLVTLEHGFPSRNIPSGVGVAAQLYYGVMSYIVAQRTAEIGVRMALGAEPRAIARAIVQQGGAVALAGIVVGLAASFAGSRVLQSLLFGVSPRDPIIFAATAALLLGVALLACWVPARRAARMNPLDALRTD